MNNNNYYAVFDTRIEPYQNTVFIISANSEEEVKIFLNEEFGDGWEDNYKIDEAYESVEL